MVVSYSIDITMRCGSASFRPNIRQFFRLNEFFRLHLRGKKSAMHHILRIIKPWITNAVKTRPESADWQCDCWDTNHTKLNRLWLFLKWSTTIRGYSEYYWEIPNILVSRYKKSAIRPDFRLDLSNSPRSFTIEYLSDPNRVDRKKDRAISVFVMRSRHSTQTFR